MMRHAAGIAAGVALALLSFSAPSGFARADEDGPNRIVRENMNPGSTGWTLPWPGYTISDDIGLQVKGYVGNETVEPGGAVTLKVTTTPAQPFTVDVFRLGDYHGANGRWMAHLGPFAGTRQPKCGMVVATRMNFCNWTTSAVVHIPHHWISGVFVAVMSTPSKYQSLAPFWVVEPNRHSDLIMISSLNTYEAYNDFPYDVNDPSGSALPLTGHSLYDFSSAGGVPATKVTFDRPFSWEYTNPGDGGVYDFEPEMIGFLERSGYDVTYAPDPLIDAQPWILQRHKVVIIAGHAEYQTMNSYNGLYAARDAGVGLAFLSGNEIYWQVRYEPLFGVDRRIVVGYKLEEPDPIRFTHPELQTINWRNLGRPEQRLIGVQLPFNGFMNWGGQPWVPENTNYWAFEGTALHAGVPVKAEVAGYEIDSYDPTVGLPDGTGYTLLSSSPFLTVSGVIMTQNSSIYCSHAGNYVWASGSMDWSWDLYPGGSSAGQNNVTPSLQRMTHNVLGRMIELAPHGDDEHVFAPRSFMRPLGTFEHQRNGCVREEDFRTH